MYKYLERHKEGFEKCELQIHIEELRRCEKDPMYFFNNYVKVVIENDKHIRKKLKHK